MLQSVPFETSGEVPVSVVNYVARTQAPVVLNDAYHDITYGTDKYISEHRTRSLLCLPLVHHGTLSGVLYLENNLATNVFTPGRLELLKALTSQAAISIENAHIYDALRESESRFRALAETSSAGILVYRQKFLYVNPAAERLSGYSGAELLSMHVWDIVHPDFREMIKGRVLDRLMDKAAPSHYEFMIIRKDGETRWVDASVTLFQYQGRPAGLAILIDITDRKRAEEGLKAAKSQVEMYLDLMSHDITNMNQIGIGFLEFALSTMKFDEAERELISKPLEALQSSTRLIENVRKLQRVIEGGIRHYETNVDQVIRDLIPTFSSILGRDIRIHYTGCKCTILANELLTDVFTNIIGNSIKHSIGQLIINITLEKVRVEGKSYCRVTIEDNGPGITDELKVRLFTRFQKGTTRTSGKGLGLYLVKVLVEDYGGKVWLEDCVAGEHGRGCRFVIMLPAID
jgi:PAS domain S-box-containing protein